MYSIDNQNIVSNSFLSFLKKVNFIEDITNDETIIVEEKDKNAPLKRIEITRHKNDNIFAVWRINLEKEITINFSGKSNKIPEIALLVFKKSKGENQFNLSVIFVELKSTIEPSSLEGQKRKIAILEECLEKFKGGMNKMYMFLSLDNFPQEYFTDKEILLDFKGVVFYKIDNYEKKSREEKNLQLDNQKMYQIFKKKSPNIMDNLLTCESGIILNDKEKIKIAFHQKTSINLEDLMKM